MENKTALVTGATGYVGSLLVRRLADTQWAVKVLVRSKDKAKLMPWADLINDSQECESGRVVVIEGDALNQFDLDRALEGVDVAWYLLHSMGNDRAFVEEERLMAQMFAQAVKRALTERIVYLGALAPHGEKSLHLESRRQVGRILESSGALTIGLSAGLVVGDRSASFAMLRHLAERLPLIVAPRWMHNRITPISEKDLLYLLESAGTVEVEESRLFDIGSAEEISYVEMLTRYVTHFHLGRKRIWTAPIGNARVASWVIGLLTPVDRHLAEPLVESMVHDTVVAEWDFSTVVGEPLGGLDDLDEAFAATALSISPHRWRKIIFAVSASVAATATMASAFMRVNSPWYQRLPKTSLKPPRWVFPIVWTVLYADLALTGALTLADIGEADPSDMSSASVTAEMTAEEKRFIAAGVANLALNAAWPLLFFKLRHLPAAAIECALLATSSIDLVRRVGKINAGRGVVLSPYALWTTYATLLTTRIAAKARHNDCG
ncbi:MAG: tryptophan-rich sensory protein [Actinomycetaceae bacterium]|nr:tryptophan-rich sensory protein [Actinomycetaceae bacterium]